MAPPAALGAAPEGALLPAVAGLVEALSRPAGVGADGLPLRPAEDDALAGDALLVEALALGLELERELLCEGVEGIDAEGEDDDDELEGIEGIELCEDCCWLVDSHPASTQAMAPASNHCFDTAVFMMSRLSEYRVSMCPAMQRRRSRQYQK